MPEVNSDFKALLPNIQGLVDSKAETQIYRAFLSVYEYFTAKLNEQQREFDRKLSIATKETSSNLNSLIGVFSQPLAGSTTTDPLLESLIQNFGSQDANKVLAAPDGISGNALFRFLVANDIPPISAAKITTGVLVLARLDTKILKTDDDLSVDITGAPLPSNGFIIISDNDGHNVKLLTTA